MNEPIVLQARLEGGKFTLNKDRLRDELRGRKDGDYTVTIERQHATRSAAQNAAYWGVTIRVLSEHTGYTADEIHDYLKAKFLPKTLSLPDANGEIKDEFTVGRTTTRLNKIEFGEYMERIAQWASEELNVYIPPPDPDFAWKRQSEESTV